MQKYYEYLYLENINKDISLEKKIEAITELGKMHSIDAIPKLREIAKNKNSLFALRIASIFALAEIGNSNFLNDFMPLKDIETDDLLEVIIIAIGKLKAAEFIYEFENYVNYINTNIKNEIISALAKIDTEESVKIMIKFYNDKDSEIKDFVKFNLRESKAFKNYIEKMNDEEILNIITLVPSEKAEELVKKLINTSKEQKILRILIKAVGELKLENGLSILKDIYLKHNEKDIKIKILDSIQNIDEQHKKEFLLKILKEEEDRDIRVKIVFALGTIKNDRVVNTVLMSIAKNTKEWWMLRKVSIMILGELSGKEFINDFVAILKNKSEDTRVIRTVIQELGNIGDSSISKYIEEYLDTDEMELKKVIVLALSKLGDKKILDKLVEDNDLREKLMPESLKAIINFDDSRIVDILLDIVDKKKENMIDIVLEGLSEVKSDKVKNKLINLVLNNEIKREIRAKAFLVLANYKDSEVIQVVENILDRVNEWWMLKKIAVIIAGELRAYSLCSKIIKYANDLDDRISKNAVEVSRKFYEEYFLKEIEKSNPKLLNIAKDFLTLI